MTQTSSSGELLQLELFSWNLHFELSRFDYNRNKNLLSTTQLYSQPHSLPSKNLNSFENLNPLTVSVLKNSLSITFEDKKMKTILKIILTLKSKFQYAANYLENYSLSKKDLDQNAAYQNLMYFPFTQNLHEASLSMQRSNFLNDFFTSVKF